MVPFGDFHIFLSLNSSTLKKGRVKIIVLKIDNISIIYRASSGVMVAHLMPTLYFRTALAQSIVTYRHKKWFKYTFDWMYMVR